MGKALSALMHAKRGRELLPDAEMCTSQLITELALDAYLKRQVTDHDIVDLDTSLRLGFIFADVAFDGSKQDLFDKALLALEGTWDGDAVCEAVRWLHTYHSQVTRVQYATSVNRLRKHMKEIYGTQ